jgi:hypothetical protein
MNSDLDVAVRKFSAMQSIVDVRAAGRIHRANCQLSETDAVFVILRVTDKNISVSHWKFSQIESRNVWEFNQNYEE